MLPISRPIRKMRRCLHCKKFFVSASAAERVCSKCRRKHNKLIERYGGTQTVVSTPQMASHLRKVEENAELDKVIPISDIYAFLDGSDNVDDSKVYAAVKRLDNETAESSKKPEAVFLLNSILKESSNVKEKTVIVMRW